jgi:hypothetical protein
MAANELEEAANELYNALRLFYWTLQDYTATFPNLNFSKELAKLDQLGDEAYSITQTTRSDSEGAEEAWAVVLNGS